MGDIQSIDASLDSLDTKNGEVQTTPTANTVLARLKDLLSLIVLAAGSNIVGKVGIDQTTPGTTNAVVEASAADIKTAVQLIDNFISGSRGLVTEDNSASIKTAVEAVNTALQTSGISQVQFAAMVTALQTIDNMISGAGANITQLGSAAVPIGAGLEATAIRITLPTDGTGVVKLGAGTAEIGKLAAGTAEIGNVKNSGTFAVQAAATLAAETTKVIGTVNIAAAQTIAAVTAITNALPAGTNLLGKVGIDQVTANANEVVIKSGTVTAVTGITNALPTGSNAIGKLAANSGVDIGDVDVTSLPSVATATPTAVTVGNTSTAVLASNAARKFAIFVNDSSEAIYLALAATAVMNQGIRLNAYGGSFETNLLNLYTGAVAAICASGSKVLCVTSG